MAPLSGGGGDAAAVAAAVALAEPFGAEMLGVYTPADVADVMPWMGEGFLGGVQTTALESLKEAAQAGEKNARRHGHGEVRQEPLHRPADPGLGGPVGGGRLSDVVVFTSDPRAAADRWRRPSSRWWLTNSARCWSRGPA
jgi:hypothetical protein